MKVKISYRLQELLDKRGITQKQLAHETFIQPYIIRHICGNTPEEPSTVIKFGTLEIIAGHLGITDINELIELKVLGGE